MTSNEQRPKAVTAPSDPSKYEPPRLTLLGRLGDVTGGGPGDRLDGGTGEAGNFGQAS